MNPTEPVIEAFPNGTGHDAECPAGDFIADSDSTLVVDGVAWHELCWENRP